MTSNVGQNYPYTSETEAERAAAIAALVARATGLAAKLAAETTPLDDERALVGLEVPDAGLPGPPPRRGYALEKHAVFVVCDGTCAQDVPALTRPRAGRPARSIAMTDPAPPASTAAGSSPTCSASRSRRRGFGFVLRASSARDGRVLARSRRWR